MVTRRILIGAGAGLLACAELSRPIRAEKPARIIEIHMKSDPMGSVVGFDPVGVFLEPGQKVRWVCDANVHTTTAYSPKNGHHSRRIPRDAVPWASDFLQSGQSFEVTLTVEGVYDYFCAPHEMAGMVGRLVVGKAIGPGTLPFDYYEANGKHWMPVPAAAQRTFPAIDAIMSQKVVRSTLFFPR
jgi:plastocyanin